jgi:DnaJ-class molecular chaperone
MNAAQRALEATLDGDHAWREKNEGLMAPDDCRECCGMGRVPTGQVWSGFMMCATFGPCPECNGSGKMAADAQAVIQA